MALDDERRQFQDITAHSFDGGEITSEAQQIEEDIRLREQFGRLIGQLDSEQLGRAIVTTKRGTESVSVRQTDTGMDVQQHAAPQETEYIGYSLPMQEGHLVLLIDGTMLRTRAFQNPNSSEEIKEIYRNNYNKYFGENSFPFNIEMSSPAAFRSNLYIGRFDTSVTDNSLTTEDPDAFADYLDEAISIGRERKQQRDASRRAGMRTVIEKLGSFLNPKPENPHHIPPPEPPQAPPPFQG